MGKTVAEKMGVKPNTKAFFMNPDIEVINTIELPTLEIFTELNEKFDYIHLFAKTQADFKAHFPKLKLHLEYDGMLWVSWPKGGGLGTDLDIKTVIKLGYDYGLVESKCLSINNVWSGLKFTHPKVGKAYNNSYGMLSQHNILI